MKICFISSYPPDKEGVAIYTKRLVDKLKDKKIDVDVLTFKKNNSQEKNVNKILSSNPFSIVRAHSALKEINPDVIHLQYATSIYKLYTFVIWFILRIFKARNKVKIAVTFHEVKRETDSLKFIGLMYYRLFSRLFDLIVVHTDEAKKILVIKCGVSESKVKVIPHGTFEFKEKIDFSKYLTKKFKLANKEIILYFGYIHVDKGVQYLIKAAKILLEESPGLRDKIKVLIAGSVRPRNGFFKIFEKKDRDYLESLIALKEELKLGDSVSFTGYIEEKQKYSLFNFSKIIVMPYTNVEQSGVLNWALAANRPIVASNLGGLKETLQGSGVLVPPKNPRKIAQEIKRLLQNKKYYSRIVQNYKKINSSQSPNNVIKMLIQEYRNLK